MNKRPELWTLDQLEVADLGQTRVWASERFSSMISDRFDWQHVGSLEDISEAPDTLVVVGGGERMDLAKLWRHDNFPDARLVVIPSLWGSGAEASPIAIRNVEGNKQISMGEEFLPDVRVIWPELAGYVSEDLALYACGDTWAHALEGFLSPLADEALRTEMAGLMVQMMELPVTNDPAWFEPSALACAGQARAGVGLVHGISHVIEGPIREKHPGSGWGHAKLCSVFLYPVMSYNRQASDKWDTLVSAHDLDGGRLMNLLRGFFDKNAYSEALVLVESLWKNILRDPSTRINSALVRPAALTYFTGWEFPA